jgi:transposase
MFGSAAASFEARTHLVQAATVLLSSCRKWTKLRAWGMKIAKKRGFRKARIAVARRLAILLHRMWVNDQDFRWTNRASDKELAAPSMA